MTSVAGIPFVCNGFRANQALEEDLPDEPAQTGSGPPAT